MSSLTTEETHTYEANFILKEDFFNEFNPYSY